MPRTVAEIKRDVRKAGSTGNNDRIAELAVELESIDSSEAKALAHLCHSMIAFDGSDYDGVLEHATQALGIYEEVGNEIGMANAHTNLGNRAMSIGEHNTAMTHYQRSLELHTSNNNPMGRVSALSNLAVILINIGKADEALAHFEQSYDITVQEGDEYGQAMALANMSGYYFDVGDYGKALELNFKALALHQNNNNEQSTAFITQRIGQIYQLMGDYPRALELFNEARSFQIANLGNTAQAITQRIIGNTYAMMGDFDSAAREIEDALAVFLTTSEYHGIVASRLDLALVYSKMNDASRAAQHLEQIELHTLKNTTYQVKWHLASARVQHQNGNHSPALSHLSIAITLAEEHHLKPLTLEIHQELAAVTRANGDIDAFLHHFDTAQELERDLKGQQTSRRIAVQEQEREMHEERKAAEQRAALLYSTMPRDIAERMIGGDDVSGDEYPSACVMFVDIVNFTTRSTQHTPKEITVLLGKLFTAFDEICTEEGVQTIKTIGDAYLAVAMSEDPNDPLPSLNVARAVKNIMNVSEQWPDGTSVQLRAGVHSGHVIAGVIGSTRLQYDIWGDTVNTASRMESSGEPGKIQVSQAFVDSLDDNRKEFSFIVRGSIDIKGKGSMDTFWLS